MLLYSRLARTRSSHKLDDEEELDEPVTVSPKTNNPNAYLAAKGYAR